MFLEFETRDGKWMCINVNQIIMVEGVCTEGSKGSKGSTGHAKIHLRDGVVIYTSKPYRTIIYKVLKHLFIKY